MSGLYEASIPVYQRGLTGLGAMLEKAAAHTGTGDPTALLGMTLAEKLNPLVGQVGSACRHALLDPKRVLGLEIVKPEKLEPTYPALRSRIAETLESLATIDANELDRAAEGTVTIGRADRGNLRSIGSTFFILASSIPQFFFHLTTVYVTLRHHGVALRKPDFLGSNAPS